MKVLVFGATGMVGQGVLRECLLAADVELVRTVGRSASSAQDTKLSQLVVSDMFDLSAFESELSGFDACFFCLGASSTGMTEAAYSRLTYELTTGIAATLLPLNPAMTFVYVSGAGTDSSESGRTMWARVKGRTENALLRMPFRATYMFRPGFIEPMHGIVSKTRTYRILYALLKPLFPVLRIFFPKYMLTTEEIGKAMLIVARKGALKPVLETWDIRGVLSQS